MQTHQDLSSTQGADFMKLSPAEQEAIDVQQPADHAVEGEHKKKSMVGKVKDKAKKLTTKIKDATKKRKDEHGNEVDVTSSSSSGEEEAGPEHYSTPASTGSGYEASPEASKDGVVHGGEEYKSKDIEGTGLPAVGQAHGVSDRSAPAVGDSWPASRDEPRAATTEAPSYDETQKRQNEVPSALGGESAGVAAGLTSSGLGTDHNKGTDNQPRDINESSGGLAGQTEEKVPEDILKPTKSDQPQPVVEGVDSSGRDLVASEVATPMEEQKPTTDTEHGTAAEGALNKSNSQKGWMQRATEGVTSVKNALLGSPKAPASTPVSGTPEQDVNLGGESGKGWTDKARETAVSMKDTISSKLPTSTGAGTGTVETGPKDIPASEGEYKSSGSPTVTSRAVGTVTGMKDTVASKLGFGKGSETTAPPAAPGSDVDTQKPGLTQKVVDVKDTIASKLGYGSSPQEPGTVTEKVEGADSGSKLFSPDEHDTALSQKITDMLTLKGSSAKSGESTNA